MYDFPTRAGEPEGRLRTVATRKIQKGVARTCPSLDRIKREKGVWGMPLQQEAMKDVIPCDKLWGAGNRL